MSEKSLTDAKLTQIAISFAFLGINSFNPVVSLSEKWIHWITHISLGTCAYCMAQNGMIYPFEKIPSPEPPVHGRCRCECKALLAILSGTATIHGKSGADYWIKYFKRLPFHYVQKDTAIKMGWDRKKGNLWDISPGTILGGEIYANRDFRLPDTANRIWYEADINYTGGYRNDHRLLYSNDGLFFVKYDHYRTFYELK